MAVGRLAQVRSIAAPAKEFLWELVIPQVPGAAADASLALTLRARTAVIPGEGTASVTSWFKGVPTKHPSQKTFPGILPMRFEEGLDATVLSTIKAWNKAWIDAGTGDGEGEAAVKTDALLRVLDHSDEIVTTIHLYGVYPETVPDASLSYESSNLLHIDVNFSYDYWDLE